MAHPSPQPYITRPRLRPRIPLTSKGRMTKHFVHALLASILLVADASFHLRGLIPHVPYREIPTSTSDLMTAGNHHRRLFVGVLSLSLTTLAIGVIVVVVALCLYGVMYYCARKRCIGGEVSA